MSLSPELKSALDMPVPVAVEAGFGEHVGTIFNMRALLWLLEQDRFASHAARLGLSTRSDIGI
jgi:hypothetical protein